LIAWRSTAVIFEYIGFLNPFTPWVASNVNGGATGKDADNKVGTGVGVEGKLGENALANNT
jgi:hypothetical protein